MHEEDLEVPLECGDEVDELEGWETEEFLSNFERAVAQLDEERDINQHWDNISNGGW